MFDMSWGEMMVIGGVALVVIGPKDLPKALRTLGQMTTKVRRMAGEFRSQFDEAMREAELEDVKKEVEGLNRSVASASSAAFDPIRTIRDELKGAVDAPPAPATPAEAALFGVNPGPIEPLPPLPDAPPAADPPSAANDPLNPETAPLVPPPRASDAAA